MSSCCFISMVECHILIIFILWLSLVACLLAFDVWGLETKDLEIMSSH